MMKGHRDLSLLCLVVMPALVAGMAGAAYAQLPAAIQPDPLIQSMINQVTADDVVRYDRELAGELAVWVDGAWYTIPTRYTYSGTAIQKTTRYIGQHLASLGLDVEYQAWDTSSNPNVIGELAGSANPDDIFIIGAHADDVQNTPGADDNASGAAAILIAADILSQYEWGCTLRFAFWTGEEQNLDGSDAYAYRAWTNDENIGGYLSLDMIGYNSVGSSPGIDLMYDPDTPGSQSLAQLYGDVVDAYGLNLVPDIVPDYWWESDHASFWEYGYTAIMAIEDENDLNPWYHTSGDTPARLDQAYFVQLTKASIATFAHMSGCLISGGMGTLEGHVTVAGGGGAIAGANVVARNGAGETFTITTNGAGYYSLALPAGSYAVTVAARGYRPGTAPAVEVVAGQVTTQDFSLEAAVALLSYLPLVAR